MINNPLSYVHIRLIGKFKMPRIQILAARQITDSLAEKNCQATLLHPKNWLN